MLMMTKKMKKNHKKSRNRISNKKLKIKINKK